MAVSPAERGFIGIGVFGLGVVGGGLVRSLREKADRLAARLGVPLRLTRVLVRDPDKARLVEVPRGLLVTNPLDILGDPETDVVVEVMGGEEPAHRLIREALAAGKHVVTANKEVMAKHGPQLLAMADEHRVELRFEASVGAGIPLIGSLGASLAANQVTAIWAIINGTTNYVLTRMTTEDMDFLTALGLAQELGYAEPDPTNDVEGIDAAYKLAILATLAFGIHVRPEEVFREGISGLHGRDFRYAGELGYAIKLLAIAKEEDGAIQARVHPVFLPQDLLLARVDGVYNALQVQGDLVGRLLFYGEGAGAYATASALLSDVLDVGRCILQGGRSRASALVSESKRLVSMADLHTRYYLRITVHDRTGVLAQISQVFARWEISIASVIQKETDEVARTAEMVILTHMSCEAAVQKALAELAELPAVEEIGSLIRLEL